MFWKCWKGFSLQLVYQELSNLIISPEIPPDLSKAAESFLLIWEGDKPDIYRCELVLPGGLFSLLWMLFKQLFKQCWSVLWDLSLAKVFDAEFSSALMICMCPSPDPTMLLLNWITSIVMQWFAFCHWILMCWAAAGLLWAPGKQS